MNRQAVTRSNESNNVKILTKADAETFCARFQENLGRLQQTIETETLNLREMNIANIEDLQNSKSALSRTYAKDIDSFTANAVEIGKLAPQSVDALRRKHQLLRVAIVENEQILSVVKDVSETLIRRTAERVANANQPKTYTSSAAGASSQMAAAVACDRKL